MILPLQHGHKTKKNGRRGETFRRTTLNTPAPQPTRTKGLGRSPIGRGPDRLLQAARSLAVKKSEKSAEHRYKLSSADIAVVTVRRLPPMSECGTKRTSQSRALMSALWGNADITWKRRHFRFGPKAGIRRSACSFVQCRPS